MTSDNKRNNNKQRGRIMNEQSERKQSNEKNENIGNNEKKNGGFYERKPIEEIRTFKSRDGKFFVIQVIKTCIFPVNYVRTIVENENPYGSKGSQKQVSEGKK